MRFAIIAMAALVAAGCISIGGPSYSSLKPGASKAQVMKAMDGCPHVSTSEGQYEALSYNGRMPRFFQWKPANYVFIFKDGALVEFGEGTASKTVVSGETRLTLKPPPKPAT
jgi:hypothetical protein